MGEVNYYSVYFIREDFSVSVVDSLLIQLVDDINLFVYDFYSYLLLVSLEP